MKKRLCYIISNIHQSNELEWTLDELSKHYSLSVILLNPTSDDLYQNCPFVSFIKARNIPLYEVSYNSKKNLLSALIKVSANLARIKPIIVHAHLFDASLIGLLSAYFLRVKHRIYTRHHSSYHLVFFPHAVKYDKLINRLSTKIIAISKVVQDILVNKENTAPQKTQIIYHGNNPAKVQFESERINSIKIRYSLNDHSPIIGVISRYIEWKGVQYIIPAFQQLLADFPNAKLVLVGTGGPFSPTITNLLGHLPKSRYTEVTFETDIWNLYKSFDILVHAPINEHSEAFGQVYIEAMQSRTPLICTRSGIANELLEHEKNALICNYRDSESILTNLKRILADQRLRENITQQAYADVQAFTFQKKIQSLMNLYNELN